MGAVTLAPLYPTCQPLVQGVSISTNACCFWVLLAKSSLFQIWWIPRLGKCCVKKQLILCPYNCAVLPQSRWESSPLILISVFFMMLRNCAYKYIFFLIDPWETDNFWKKKKKNGWWFWLARAHPAKSCGGPCREREAWSFISESVMKSRYWQKSIKDQFRLTNAL